jgi:2-dehydro-3-deoxyphosphogluconate aldolase/(4S)-4-hydroxy-2-oxoglutarate aldolase
MAHDNLLSLMCDTGVLPVFRTDEIQKVLPVSLAFLKAGVRVIEYTLTMPKALALIERAVAELPPDVILGAGTALDGESARLAILAGAKFVVSPGLSPEVVEMCHRYGVPTVAGACTPTEIMNALKLGVRMIKIFPSNSLSPAHIADLKAPFPQAQFMIAGGISLENVGAYIKAGADVVTVGGHTINPAAFASGDFTGITKVTKDFLNAIAQARGK